MPQALTLFSLEMASYCERATSADLGRSTNEEADYPKAVAYTLRFINVVSQVGAGATPEWEHEQHLLADVFTPAQFEPHFNLLAAGPSGQERVEIAVNTSSAPAIAILLDSQDTSSPSGREKIDQSSGAGFPI